MIFWRAYIYNTESGEFGGLSRLGEFSRQGKLCTILHVVLVMVIGFIGCQKAEGHAPKKLMKVSYEVKGGSLLCKVEAHFSQLYTLKRKEISEVTKSDHPGILRSLRMNCPVMINEKSALPELVAISFPAGKEDASQADHFHDEDEKRYFVATFRYPIQQDLSKISIKWGLIPQQVESLPVTLRVGATLNRYQVSLENPSFKWIKP